MRRFLTIVLMATFLAPPAQSDTSFATALVAAARAQIGITTQYDPAYVRLSYPMGDVDRTKGVCTDVVIRALRDAHNIDLQARVHRDMAADFGAYPNNWGLTRPDKNIDHRRVPNLRRYFTRRGHSLPVGTNPQTYRPGDVVTWRLPGNLTHIGIVAEATAPDGTPLIIHNIGQGARRENILFAFEITGHYRLSR